MISLVKWLDGNSMKFIAVLNIVKKIPFKNFEELHLRFGYLDSVPLEMLCTALTVNFGLVSIKYKNTFWTYITVPQKYDFFLF